jgi:hypothetical protein
VTEVPFLEDELETAMVIRLILVFSIRATNSGVTVDVPNRKSSRCVTGFALVLSATITQGISASQKLDTHVAGGD